MTSAVVGFDWAHIPCAWPSVRIESLVSHVDDPSTSGLEQLHMLSKERGVLPRDHGSQGFSEADSYVGYKKFHAGDIIMNKMQAWNGVFGLASSSGIVSPDYATFRPDLRTVDARFLVYLLKDPIYAGIFSGISRGMGTGFNRVHPEQFLKVPVSIPELEDQRRIADFLDTETARIDRLISLRGHQSRLMEERRASSLDMAFSHPSFSPTRLKHLLASKPRYGVLVPQFIDGDGVRFIRVNDLLDLPGRAASLRRIPDGLSAQYARTITRAGDVLLSVVGTMGRSAIVPPELEGANVARAVASLRPRTGVSAELISAWLTTPQFMRQAVNATSSDTAQPTLGMEDLANFTLSWPGSTADQENLMRLVRATQQRCSSLIKAFQAQSRLLAERRQALITAAVSGQFDVSTASGRNVTEGVAV
ncbi:restriction endonuclease subunit S [Streptomyces griseorubiginosus]|uniref:restriction endonuclease subunit S n=1 Tax=Streptomyces griseorubiginosus TaxID=67304 RepID=UPI003636101A